MASFNTSSGFTSWLVKTVIPIKNGGFIFNLDNNNGETIPTCQDLNYRGTALTRINFSEDDGIKIAINGVDMDYCPDQYGRKSDNANFKGTEGHPYWGVLCYYKAGIDYTSSTINKIEVKEYDHSDSYGRWNWEIWHK